MERVRLMVWCRTCLTGLHLPAFAAAEGGLFAEHGLELDFVDLIAAPDFSFQGFATRPKAVAAGRADFALTSVAYLLAAQETADGRLPVRFAAVAHQRSPLCAVVRADSGLETAEDLAGRRAARWRMPWFTQDYVGALERMGIEAPVVVETPGDLDMALAAGEIDVIPTFSDMVWHHEHAGVSIRAIPLDIDVYMTGLVAADRLAPEVIAAVREAYIAGYDLQRAQPELGIAAFRRRYPDVSADHMRMSWARFEPYAFDGGLPGTMTADRWETTIAYTARTHGLPTLPGERIYRPELLTPPREPSSAIADGRLASVHHLRARSGARMSA